MVVLQDVVDAKSLHWFEKHLKFIGMGVVVHPSPLSTDSDSGGPGAISKS